MIEYINKSNYLTKRDEFMRELRHKGVINRKTISLCMMVKNEQDWVAEAIYSCYPIVDEIVVVDTGSTDNTLNILKEIPNVKIVKTIWEDDFSKPRNLGIENCTKDWILRIDADERIPVNTLAYFWSLAQAKDESIKAFIVPIKNYLEQTDKENPSFFISETLRFFKRHPKIRYQKAIHEDIDSSFKEITDEPVKVARSEAHFDHYGYLRNSESLKKKHAHYAEILIKEIDKNPKDPSFYYALAHHYKAIRNYNLAEEYYLKTIDASKEFWAAWSDLGTLNFWKGNFAKAKECYEIAKSNMSEMASPIHKQRIDQNLKDMELVEKRWQAMFISDSTPLDLKHNKI